MPGEKKILAAAVGVHPLALRTAVAVLLDGIVDTVVSVRGAVDSHSHTAADLVADTAAMAAVLDFEEGGVAEVADLVDSCTEVAETADMEASDCKAGGAGVGAVRFLADPEGAIAAVVVDDADAALIEADWDSRGGV